MYPKSNTIELWGRFLAVSLYLAWMARDLAEAWRNDPLNRGAVVAFVTWSIVVVVFAFFGKRRVPGFHHDEKWLLGGVLIATVGAMGDLHFLAHLAFSVGVCSVIPNGVQRLIALVAAICWMPAFNWIVQEIGVLSTDERRLYLLSLALFPGFFLSYTVSPKRSLSS